MKDYNYWPIPAKEWVIYLLLSAVCLFGFYQLLVFLEPFFKDASFLKIIFIVFPLIILCVDLSLFIPLFRVRKWNSQDYIIFHPRVFNTWILIAFYLIFIFTGNKCNLNTVLHIILSVILYVYHDFFRNQAMRNIRDFTRD